MRNEKSESELPLAKKSGDVFDTFRIVFENNTVCVRTAHIMQLGTAGMRAPLFKGGGGGGFRLHF